MGYLGMFINKTRLRVYHVILYTLFMYSSKTPKLFKNLKHCEVFSCIFFFRNSYRMFIILHWKIYGEVLGQDYLYWGNRETFWCHSEIWWYHRDRHILQMNLLRLCNNDWTYLYKVWIQIPGFYNICQLIGPSKRAPTVN